MSPNLLRTGANEPTLAERVDTLGPLLLMAKKPSAWISDDGDASVFHTRPINDLSVDVSIRPSRC